MLQRLKPDIVSVELVHPASSKLSPQEFHTLQLRITNAYFLPLALKIQLQPFQDFENGEVNLKLQQHLVFIGPLQFHLDQVFVNFLLQVFFD